MKKQTDHNADISKMDTIYRQAAIDAHCELCEDKGFCGDICPDVEVFRLIPTAQPELAQDLPNACADAISRQQAIDALYDWSNHTMTDAEAWHLRQVIGDIKSMPPAQPEYTEQDMREQFNAGYACGMHAAQPEIIRCKDCKKNPHWEWVGCPMTGKNTRKPDDFCSYAERREE